MINAALSIGYIATLQLLHGAASLVLKFILHSTPTRDAFLRLWVTEVETLLLLAVRGGGRATALSLCVQAVGGA